jgi:enoyl-[acyl-carrier protein] reductase I
MKDLKGKVVVVTGIANKRSIAFAIAKDLAAHGAKLVVAYQPLDRGAGDEKILKVAEELRPAMLQPLDAVQPESVRSLFEEVGKKFGKLDVLVHSIASAKREELAGRFSDISLDGYLFAQQVSAFSLIDLVRAARPLLTKEGGSVITMSYIGSVRAAKNYNVMGPAKAALEANVRYLAEEFGQENVRVNGVSAGPIRTLSASGIRDFLDLLHQARNLSAFRRNITQEEVAHTVSFLSSSQSSGITGQVIYVDGGFNNFG